MLNYVMWEWKKRRRKKNPKLDVRYFTSFTPDSSVIMLSYLAEKLRLPCLFPKQATLGSAKTFLLVPVWTSHSLSAPRLFLYIVFVVL